MYSLLMSARPFSLDSRGVTPHQFDNATATAQTSSRFPLNRLKLCMSSYPAAIPNHAPCCSTTASRTTLAALSTLALDQTSVLASMPSRRWRSDRPRSVASEVIGQGIPGVRVAQEFAAKEHLAVLGVVLGDAGLDLWSCASQRGSLGMDGRGSRSRWSTRSVVEKREWGWGWGSGRIARRNGYGTLTEVSHQTLDGPCCGITQCTDGVTLDLLPA
jgi:hypothetical protein